jgi:hypothetical protein
LAAELLGAAGVTGGVLVDGAAGVELLAAEADGAELPHALRLNITKAPATQSEGSQRFVRLI